MSIGFAIEKSLHLLSVSNLRIILVFSRYGLLKLAFRARKLSGAFEKRAPDVLISQSALTVFS